MILREVLGREEPPVGAEREGVRRVRTEPDGATPPAAVLDGVFEDVEVALGVDGELPGDASVPLPGEDRIEVLRRAPRARPN